MHWQVLGVMPSPNIQVVVPQDMTLGRVSHKPVGCWEAWPELAVSPDFPGLFGFLFLPLLAHCCYPRGKAKSPADTGSPLWAASWCTASKARSNTGSRAPVSCTEHTSFHPLLLPGGLPHGEVRAVKERKKAASGSV